jgi:hypothetical protein
MRQTFSEFHDPDEGLDLIGEDRADAFSHPDRRLPTMLLTVLVMALFAGGLWFAYVQGTRHPAATAPGEGVPLIRADERPAKVKPDQPGGMAIPDQNVSLYNEKPGGAPVEKLLPAAEQPMPRSATSSAGAPPASQTAQPSAKAAADAAPQPPAKAPAPAKQATLGAAAAAPAGKASPVQVQLVSVRSPEAAREEWARLKRENPDLLGRLTAVAVRTDLGDKGIYYRVLAGSFGDTAAAEKLCSELKQRQLGCILAR